MKITVTSNNVVYEITFKHFRQIESQGGMPYATRCVIKKMLDAPIPIFTGYAFCSEKDTFCYEVGRKIALGRALLNLPRAERKTFWDAYFNRFAKEKSWQG